MAAPATLRISPYSDAQRLSDDEPLSASVIAPGLNRESLNRICDLEQQLVEQAAARVESERGLRDDRFRLSQQVDVLSRQHRADEAALRANEEARLRLEAQIAELTETNRANQEQIGHLTGQLAALRLEHAALTSQLSLLTAQLEAALTHGREQSRRIDQVLAVAQQPQQQPPASPPSRLANWFLAALEGPFAIAELVQKEFS
jgi:chromosome segregation ATPase